MKRMASRVLTAVAFAVLLIGGAVGWSMLSRYWTTHNTVQIPRISDLQSGAWPQESSKWQALGTGAVPILIRASQQQPDALRTAYSNAWARMPAQIRSNLPVPVDDAKIRMSALALLADPQIGTNLQISALTNALQDKSWPVRYNALACLGNGVLARAGSEKIQILPQLIAAAADQEEMIRMVSVACLEFYQETPERVVPTLRKGLADASSDVRIRAVRALYKVDPVAAQKAGVLSVAANCLHSDGSKAMAKEFLEKLGKLPSNEQN